MKTKLFILLLFLTAFGLTACVKNQDTAPSGNVTAMTPDNQNINDTNYQQMLRNQTARAQAVSAGRVGGGGHR